MATIHSRWTQTPITLAQSLLDPIWADAGKMTIPGGFMLAKNDANFLYVALDMVSDTGNDAGTNDYFWFTFDTNRNGSITPNKDLNYGPYPGNPNKMGRQFYLAPGTWTGLSQDSATCQKSFEASPNHATPHRVWKLRFKLSEINVSLTPFWWAPFTRFGFRVNSATPAAQHNFPANFWMNFSSLHTLYFSRKPGVDLSLQGPVIGCVGLIPTTKINATGRATTDAGYFVAAQNAAFGGLLNMIGNAPNRQALWAAGARFIKVFHSTDNVNYQEYRTAWYNYRWDNPSADYVLESFGADANNFYPLQNPAVDYSIHDLLFQFDSSRLTNGMQYFRVKFYNAAFVEVPATLQTIGLYIDNALPIVKINDVKHGANTVQACDIVTMANASDGVVVNFDANDPQGNLLAWSVTAQWGDGSALNIDSDSYTPAKGNWQGVTNRNAPASGVWVPLTSCAHAFTISATARVTNGYGYIGYTSVSRFITIKK